MPLHSIIIPIYNVEHYLNQCIDSILCQDYIPFELILVDDGSTDGSSIICDEYAQRDNRVKVFHLKNGGVSKARNYGLEKAQGAYISFVDSDDFVSKDYLKVIGQAIKGEPDLITFNYIRWINSDKQETGRFRLSEGTYQEINKLYNEAICLEVVSLSVWCAIFKRSIITAYQLRFNENMKTCEDFMFSLNYYQHIQNFSAINTPLYFYRENLNSATGKRTLQHSADYQIIFDKINRILEQQSFKDEIKDLFQRRWTRWIIALVANYKTQRISNKKIEEVVCQQAYYETMLQFKSKGFLCQMERWLLKEKAFASINLYLNAIKNIKYLLKRYKL